MILCMEANFERNIAVLLVNKWSITIMEIFLFGDRKQSSLSVFGRRENSFSRCLVGLFLDHRQFDSRVMQGLVEELWLTVAPMRVVGRHDNLYLFRFYSEVDFNAFLKGPWAMRGGLLVMDIWQPGLALVVKRINRTPVWVQLYNLPLECFCEETGLRLGGMLGDVLYVDI
ncbi:hypothetical protein Vadar_017846 [Vaccinium darrowii]|uniref:Uncharacterized protein n=1 Tax=Vaccinium darrowii TaxID=229202 RepID=A0ACB7ZKY4_9ERIC|nr:hypothetical protein Vadar_017846 [Vaccinium darrowii]